MEDLQLVEHVVREDEGVVEQCVISGIPREEMHKVYCDRKCFDVFLPRSPSLCFPSASSTSIFVSSLTIVTFSLLPL